MLNNKKEQLLNIYNRFIDGISKYIDMSLLVGSLTWKDAALINSQSDIDMLLITNFQKDSKLLDIPEFRDNIHSKSAIMAINNGLADYLVVKTKVDEVDFSIDIMSQQCFENICNEDLTTVITTKTARKFGLQPQLNPYLSMQFDGVASMIPKKNTPYADGYIIELPLYVIKNNHYSHGIPTAKLISAIPYSNCDWTNNSLNNLKKNIITRMAKEHEEILAKDYDGIIHITNIFYKPNELSELYKKKLLSEERKIIRELK